MLYFYSAVGKVKEEIFLTVDDFVLHDVNFTISCKFAGCNTFFYTIKKFEWGEVVV